MAGVPSQSRLAPLDALRGLVMLLMSIDHASDAFNRGRLFTDSTLFWTPGTPLPMGQFLTRWITHLCAPSFVLLAGAALAFSVEARTQRGEPSRSIDRHILIRGALLVLFDVVWMSPALLGPGNILFQVLYAIGASLMAMALLRRLGDRALLALGVGGVLLSEAVIGLLHVAGWERSVPSALLLTGGFFLGGRFVVAYPVLPWLAIMCLGWVLGRCLRRWNAEPGGRARAARVLAAWGVAGLALFAVLRGVNAYGNMALYREGGDLVQWLHVSKYPPSATYTGLELGIAALILAALFAIEERRGPVPAGPITKLGQVALFYYLIHLHVLEGLARVTGLHGAFGAASAYIGGGAVAVALYPLTRAYARYKSAHPTGLARYV